MKTQVIDKDFGLKRIEKNLKDLGKVKITSGLHYSAGRDSAGKASGVPVAQYAYDNEFGTYKIPARPFVTTSFDESLDKLQTKISNNIAAIYEDQIGFKQALEQISDLTSNNIVNKIDSIVTPPNSPATIARKKSSKPLIDTGLMRKSVSGIIKYV
jgi:hypothetical protein